MVPDSWEYHIYEELVIVIELFKVSIAKIVLASPITFKAFRPGEYHDKTFW